MPDKPQPPSNIEAERIVVAHLLSGSMQPSALQGVTPEDFYHETNKSIIRSILRLNEKGEGISYATIFKDLRKNENSAITLTQLIEIKDESQAVADLTGFLRAIMNESARRRLIHVCQSTMQKAYLREDTPEAIDKARKLLSDISGGLEPEVEFKTIVGVIEDSGGMQRYASKQEIPGVPTNIPKLNQRTFGFRAGELVVIAGNTGHGKTALALNFAHHAATRGTGVALYEMEMSREEVVNRMIGLSARIDTQKIRKPLNGDAAEIMRAVDRMRDLPFYICDRSTCTLTSIEVSLRRLRAKHPVGMVIVDYLNLMTAVGKSDNRAQEISKMTRGLKVLAGDFGLPIVLVCQLNRVGAKETSMKGKARKPELTDLKESGSIEQDASIVMFLHNDTQIEYAPDAWMPLGLILAKQRNGPANLTIPVFFQRTSGIFMEMEKLETPEDPEPAQPSKKRKSKAVKPPEPPPQQDNGRFGYFD